MQTLTLKSVALQLAAAALVATGLLSLAVPARASGLTETQIQAIINLVASFGADQATVNNVTAALRGQATSSSGATITGSVGSCHTFATDMGVSTHVPADDVALLRFALIESLGKQANVNAYQYLSFNQGDVTAVKIFQAKYSISQTGYVGPLTRAKLNQTTCVH